MRTSSNYVKLLSTIIGMQLLLALTTASWAGTLTVHVDGLPSDAGRARIVLFGSEDGWRGKEPPVRIGSAIIENGKASWVAEDLPPGRYAIIAHHDANANDDLDRPVFTLPLEPYGYANGAWTTFGIPSWQDTSFEVGAEQAQESVTVRFNPIAAAILAVWAAWPALALILAGLLILAIYRRRRLKSAS